MFTEMWGLDNLLKHTSPLTDEILTLQPWMLIGIRSGLGHWAGSDC
jgi:hypothetical protein